MVLLMLTLLLFIEKWTNNTLEVFHEDRASQRINKGVGSEEEPGHIKFGWIRPLGLHNVTAEMNFWFLAFAKSLSWEFNGGHQC